ncbi:MAG: hypothetical protein J6S67_23385 [Methanobrevibacter sp.]|nr:hypothetical protein [Methanobrevibacter sp.]
MADILRKILNQDPLEQWPMESKDYLGYDLAEIHPEMDIIHENAFEITGIQDPDTIPSVSFSAEQEKPDDIGKILQDLFSNSQPKTGQPDDISNALNRMLSSQSELNSKAMNQMFQGAVYKTVAAADDFFSRATGLIMGMPGMIEKSASIASQNYQNQMDAIDNQVLYMKHQLADRFNKTVETNIMNMAAKNIRVTAGNVLDLSKELALETTEDMRTLESNARLKKIALEAGKKSSKESARLAVKQLWTGFAQSALKLGIMWETGGGTGESWGNLYSNYKNQMKLEDAIKHEEFNRLY